MEWLTPSTGRVVLGMERSATPGKVAEPIAVSFSSEAPIDHGGQVPEGLVLLHERSAVDMGDLSASSVLWDHKRDRVLGRPENVRLDEWARMGRADLVLDDTDEFTRSVSMKVRAGSLRGVSLTFQVVEGVRLRRGEQWSSPSGRTFTGPLAVASRWRPLEISLTAVPLDPAVGVGRSVQEIHEMAGPENDDTNTNPTPTATATQAEPVVAQRAAPSVPEPMRFNHQEIAQIRSLARSAGDAGDRLLDSWLQRGLSLEQIRGECLQRMVENSPPFGIPGSGVEFGPDSRDRFQRAHVAGLLVRTGGRLDYPELKGVQPEPCSLEQLAERSLQRAGVPTRGLHGVGLFQRAMPHSTSDFSAILENVANKSLLQGWEESPPTWAPLARTVPAADFKPLSRTGLGDFAGFVPLKQLTPITESSIAERPKTSYSVGTYARRFGVSRETLFNDDMNALGDIPRKIGQAASRLISDSFYTLLTSAAGVGPTMTEDTKALFATDHPSGANYTAGTGAPDETGLGIGRKLMRLQKGLAATGETAPVLNVLPRFLLVPATLEIVAAKAINSIWLPGATNETTNPFYRSVDLIVEPRLDGATNGTTAWYLVAAPGTVDGAEVAFLGGKQTPSLERLVSFSPLGVEWLAYIDFGLAWVGHRGWYRCKGA